MVYNKGGGEKMSFTDFITNTDIHEINMLSISLRLFLAVVFGGIIGLNRAMTKRPAGFRTHILVCLGATLVMITNQYMTDILSYGTDPARLGAQVITGVGFLGAGTILMRGDKKVEGLTTAAGLWACACIGLALGIGFYAAAITATVLVFLSLTVFMKFALNIYRLINKDAATSYKEEHVSLRKKITDTDENEPSL